MSTRPRGTGLAGGWLAVGWLAVGWLAAGAGCRAVAPPPMVALHGDTAAAPPGAITALVVVGVAGQVFGGNGIGVALRVERQETRRTAAGLELTGGRGDDGYDTRWLVAARAYGKTTPLGRSWVSATYGGGVSVMDTGMIALSAHAGGAASYPNRYVAPVLGAGLAAAVPVRRGAPFPRPIAFEVEPEATEADDAPCPPTCAARRRSTRREAGELPVAELYGYAHGGLVFGNRVSLDLGAAVPIRTDQRWIMALGVAGAYRRDAD